ncbi:MAG: YetF domain-containing protein [Pyrinomonadaceae bacterium]
MSEWLFKVNWHDVFVPQSSLLEIFIRGTITYFALFLILRFTRRGTGAIGINDLLVIVLIADAAQNAMAGDYKSITEGVFLVLTIGAWDYALDWMGHKSPSIARLLRPSELLLVENGKMNRRNMRKELITVEELMSQLRQQGIEDLKDVKKCYLEGDGEISVIKTEASSADDDSSKKNERKGI